MARYICVKKCFHNGVLFRPGREANFTDDFPKDKKGNLREFRLIDEAPKVVPTEVKPGPGRPKVKVNNQEA